jgi:hypothetical protein
MKFFSLVCGLYHMGLGNYQCAALVWVEKYIWIIITNLFRARIVY